MSIFITVLVVIASILMILIVLVQNSKGGGLASGFSSSNQIMGVRKTTDFLEKATWTLAVTMAVLSIASAAFINHGATSGSEIQNTVNQEILATPVEEAPAVEAPAIPTEGAESAE